jgi:hypothetical protein
MATDKLPVTAYLHTAVYERLAQFKSEHGIQSLSQTIEVALCDYFGINVQGVMLPTSLDKQRSCTHKDDSRWEMKVAVLSSKYEYLCNVIAKLSNEQNTTFQQINATPFPIFTQPSTVEFAAVHETPLPSPCVLPKGLSSEVVKRGLTGVALAKRFNSSSSTLSNKRSKPNFSEWSMGLDPDGVAWEYRSITRKFHPVELRSK